MADRMRQNLEDSKQQATRIEDILVGLDWSRSASKDMVPSFMGNVLAPGCAPASDEVVKNSVVSYAFEHCEIASYKSLLIVAKVAGQQMSISLL